MTPLSRAGTAAAFVVVVAGLLASACIEPPPPAPPEDGDEVFDSGTFATAHDPCDEVNDECVPELCVDPIRVDFGAVPLDSVVVADVTFSNRGCADASIDGLFFDEEEGEGEAVFDSQTVVALPTFIAGGTGKTMTISATPTAVGHRCSSLVLQTNDPNDEIFVVPICVDGF